jgi:hypothetical protein
VISKPKAPRQFQAETAVSLVDHIVVAVSTSRINGLRKMGDGMRGAFSVAGPIDLRDPEIERQTRKQFSQGKPGLLRVNPYMPLTPQTDNAVETIELNPDTRA